MRCLLEAAIIMVPLLILGMFGNLHLIYATVKFKQLHHRNGILVGITAFFNFMNELFETKNAFQIFTGQSRMKRVTCYYSIFLYCCFFNMSSITLLFLAIDRLIAVWLPVKHRQMRHAYFIAVALASGFVYSTPFVVVGFIVADDALVEPCNPATAYAPHLMHIWNYSYVSVVVAIVLLNIINYFLFLRDAKKSEMSKERTPSNQQQAQVTGSMRVIMAAHAFSTLLACVILLICNFLRVDEATLNNITPFLGILELVNYGNSYYILFWRSRTYRTIFSNQLHFKSRSAISVVLVAEMKTKTKAEQSELTDQLAKRNKLTK